MLTRTSAESDFAPDASVFAAARDPRTGGRQLEELAFEIAASQSLTDAGEKARELARRGVRRVFCIAIRHRQIFEWSRETDDWSPLPNDASLDDRCFDRALPLRPLLDVTAADDEVVRALDQRGNRAIKAIEARGLQRGVELGRQEGEAKGLQRGVELGREEGRQQARAEAIVEVLHNRGIALTDQERGRILGCRDDAELTRWRERAWKVLSAADLWVP